MRWPAFARALVGQFSRSLSLRLLGIFVLTGITLLIVLSVLFSRGLGSQWQRNIQPHLALYAHYLQQDLGSPPSAERARALADALPIRISLYHDQRAVYQTHPEAFDPRSLHFRPLHEFRRWADAQETPLSIAFDRRHHNSVLRMNEGTDTVYLELLHGLGSDRNHRPLVMVVISLLVLLLASYAVIRRQLKPIARIQQGVRRMADGHLDQHIALPGRDDLASLAGSVDAMATRIQEMLDAKRQLLLAISHELRSPLARARVSVELLDPSCNRKRLREDLDDMQCMIDDIIESERLQQHAVLNLAPVELGALLTRVAEGFTETVMVELPERPVTITADAVRLAILLRNLISNALLHGKRQALQNEPGLQDTPENPSPVRVTLTVQDADICLSVIDQGPGIAPAHLAAVTEPFFRPDAARTRHDGGVGLGLTLAKLIAEAHHGRLVIQSRTQAQATAGNEVSGTGISVHLPIEPPSLAER